MKNIFIVLIAIFTLSSCTQKIGYVNTEKLIQDYEGTKKAEEELKEKQTQMASEITKLEADFQEKVKKMSQRTLSKKMNELRQEDGAIQQKKQQVQYALQNESQKTLEKVSKEVNDFVKDYAKQNGYHFILGTVEVNGAVLYGEEKADITYDVLKALNADFDNNDEKSTEVEKKTEEKKTEETVKKEESK